MTAQNLTSRTSDQQRLYLTCQGAFLKAPTSVYSATSADFEHEREQSRISPSMPSIQRSHGPLTKQIAESKVSLKHLHSYLVLTPPCLQTL